MIRFFSIVFAFLGGWIGWKLGALAGLMTAYFGGVLGTAGGITLGRRVAENLLE